MPKTRLILEMTWPDVRDALAVFENDAEKTQFIVADERVRYLRKQFFAAHSVILNLR